MIPHHPHVSIISEYTKASGNQLNLQKSSLSTSRSEQTDNQHLRTSLIRLPFVAKIERLVEDRGFGFAKCEFDDDEFFFHVTSDLTRQRDFDAINVGDLMLCQIGSRAKEPGRQCIVQWARVADLDWGPLEAPGCQVDLDARRLDVLKERSVKQLHQLMQAKWYTKQWDGEAPSDLHDPLLGATWLERISELDAEQLGKVRLAETLQSCLFDFREMIDPESSRCSVKDLLEHLSPPQLSALGEPQRKWLSASWSIPPRVRDAPRSGGKSTSMLDENDKAAILEWFILRHIGDQFDQCHLEWLEGRNSYEAVAARRILGCKLPLPIAIRDWMLSLAENDLLDQACCDDLAMQDPITAPRLLGRLSSAEKHRVRTSWKQDFSPLVTALGDRPDVTDSLVRHCVLAIDLETDGENIWEIGCSGAGPTKRLHDATLGMDFDTALVELGQRLHDATLVVGHNILAWDWPILAAHLTAQTAPLIWDTMLVQFLLDPMAPSHALGGTHHAEADAEATLALFSQQLRKLPAELVAKILAGKFNATADLFRAICAPLASAAPLVRSRPEYLVGTQQDPVTLTLLPDHELATVNWVPGISVVSANPEERLPKALWQIDVEILERDLKGDLTESPIAHVLLAVCQRAEAEKIALRRAMFPSWLIEGLEGLSEVIDGASFAPALEGNTCVAPIPRASSWWSGADGSSFRAMLPETPFVIVDRQTKKPGQTNLERVSRYAPLIKIKEPFAELWLARDCAAQCLDVSGSWRSFRTVRVPTATQLVKPLASTLTKRPYLAGRQYPGLFPGSADQASYWTGVIEALSALRREDTIPVLLVASSTSPTLMQILSAACAEIGLGEICPSHRSRREHLRRAASRGLAVVDTLDRWRDWQNLAESLDTKLQPVVEALPLEEWFALADAETSENSGSAEETPPSPSAEAIGISEASILAALPTLAGQFLGFWLEESGLSGSTHAPILLDARAEVSSFELRAFLEKYPLSDEPLPKDDRKRLQLAFEVLQVQREEAPSDLATMERFLVTNWQPSGNSGGNSVSGFKPTQKQAMEAIRTRASDVMVALPTGEGKSVLFQVPGLCRGLRNRRLTLVLSPLKALMQDQVARLHEQGFAESVDYLNSDRPRFEQAEVLQGVLDHRIVMLYVAPERLRNATFLDVLRRRMEADEGLEYVVFDEAHCVNQWGYEFRPDYFHALTFLMRSLRGADFTEITPFLLLSATLTASDQRSIRNLLAGGAPENLQLPLAICPDAAASSSPLRAHIDVDPLPVRGNILDNQDFETALAERLPHIHQAIEQARKNRRATGQRSAVIIFVTRRAHADDLAKRLTETAGCEVESYHAGLDAATRDDIYTRFRDGDLDILVATKAFGMGMDIPDIHWVVHLSPPAYLEDYLQEVGRIGRGVIEKRRAGLDQLEAKLLASPADFENMRGLRAMNELRLPQIDEIEGKINEAAEIIEGHKIAFVPSHGFEPYKSAAQMRANSTKLRMALYWLEKAGHLTQLGMVPDLLSVRLFPDRLAAIATEASPTGRVAKAIHAIAVGEDPDGSLDNAVQRHPQRSGLLGGILNWLTELVGVRTDQPDPTPIRRRLGTPSDTALINISQIRRQCRISSRDETMACLVDLQHRQGLQLRWTLEFAKRPLLSEPKERNAVLVETVGSAVRNLIQHLRSRDRADFTPFDYLDQSAFDFWNQDETPSSPKEQAERQALRRRYERAFVYGFRTLARACGIRIKQIVRGPDEGVLWQAQLSIAHQKNASGRCNELLALIPSLLTLFSRAFEGGLKEVEVHDLIRGLETAHPRKHFRIKDLETLLRLASSLNLVSVQPELVPLSYILSFSDEAPGLDRHPELVEELNDVNELAETRTFAMEVFANLPKPAREPFIGGYFAQASGAGLKTFLESQLGEIEDEGDEATGFIASKRDQLRATKAVEFFERYKNSEEPAQWQAMSHRFDQHLLVNAGPGAGKTSVLVGRIAHLIREQHIKPAEIVVLAFNRAVVFEIRKRIRDLFRTLGYAAYASQVRVHTFHGLARLSLAGIDSSAGQDLENLLENFAARLTSDTAFREQVAGGCRCILVDEFQDVTDDVYDIISNLHHGSGERAGVMVIGDDDQDILRWQRKAGALRRGGFAETYFDRFRADFGGDQLRSLELCVNFRSGAEIVEMSQKMISGFFARSDRSRRLKSTLLRQSSTAGASRCERIVVRDWGRDQVIDEIVATCLRLQSENPGSLAVLCRTNDEVAEIHRHLITHYENISVQSSENMRIADLRHVALWCDFLEVEVAKGDRALNDILSRELFARFTAAIAIPETTASGGTWVDLANLWELCCEESVFPHLSTLLRFIRNLQRDELLRLMGSRRDGQEIVVSTIHKVKGLEYDNVVVVPSRSSFGDTTTSQNALEDDAAEEARLLYVALTRAKSRLVYFMGQREFAWGRADPCRQPGVAGGEKVLTGAHDQIDLGWAVRRSHFNPNPNDCQTYIETCVVAGDRITLGSNGWTLFHTDKTGQRRQIGCVAKKFGVGIAGSDLKVSAVVRYPVADRNREVAGETAAHRGWGYAVLVAGRLR